MDTASGESPRESGMPSFTTVLAVVIYILIWGFQALQIQQLGEVSKQQQKLLERQQKLLEQQQGVIELQQAARR